MAVSQGCDSAALGAALDALRDDDAAEFVRLLQTQSWIKNEVVYADRKAGQKDRLSKGWSEEAVLLPLMAVDSLERRGLVGDLGDTLLAIARRSDKTVICAKLGGLAQVHPLQWHACPHTG